MSLSKENILIIQFLFKLLLKDIYNKIAFAFLLFFACQGKNSVNISRRYRGARQKRQKREESNERERSCKEMQYPLERRVIRIGGWTNRRKETRGVERETVRSREVGAFAIVTLRKHVSRTALLVPVIQTTLNNFCGS